MPGQTDIIQQEWILTVSVWTDNSQRLRDDNRVRGEKRRGQQANNQREIVGRRKLNKFRRKSVL